MNKNNYSISELEEGLRRITHQKWDKYEPAISIAEIKKQTTLSILQIFPSNLITKMALVSLFVCAYAIFFYTPFNSPSMFDFGNIAIPIPNVPRPTSTPTLQNTATQKAACSDVVYTVQEGDTLNSIAAKLSVSPVIIQKYNQTNIENAVPGTSLVISICQSEETTSTNEPTGTMTFAPHQ